MVGDNVALIASVATVLTVHGIETISKPLPITNPIPVATVLTVHGIETIFIMFWFKCRFDIVATVLTVHGIETQMIVAKIDDVEKVATVLTVHGIETIDPTGSYDFPSTEELQQYLPFTVLKPYIFLLISLAYINVATVLTVHGIETTPVGQYDTSPTWSCNSAYRLRY